MKVQDWLTCSPTMIHREESVLSSSLKLSLHAMSGEAVLIIEELLHLCREDGHKTDNRDGGMLCVLVELRLVEK